ncbi:MAG: hypothetical protein AAGA78_09220 [Pseudomonadota bacterium]
MYHVTGPWGPLSAAPKPRKLVEFSDWLDTVGRDVVAQAPVAVETLSACELQALGLTPEGQAAYELG